MMGTGQSKTGRLGRVVSGRIEKPIRIALYSTDGLGKSTFASNAPRPIFAGAEDGTSELEVDRLPDITTWSDVVESVSELTASAHPYKTFVLDTADWAEAMLWAHVAKSGGKKSIEDFAYGKGYIEALNEWRSLLGALDRLRDAKGMNVIILAHSWIKTFKNPEGEDFDRYEMKLHPKAAGLIREWADCVCFGTYETLTHKADPKSRARGVSTGARVIHTERQAAFDAKNRYSLPATLPLSWEAFADAVRDRRTMPVVDLLERIEECLRSADTALVDRVRIAIAAANGDATKLANILNRLNATIAPKEQVAS